MDGWKICKKPSINRSHACIPSLFKKGADGWVISELHTVTEKAALFTDLFFPPCPHNLPSLPEDLDPYPPLLKFSTPVPHQITHHINKTNPFKAPGEDGIPNVVLKECETLLMPLLYTCLLAILTTGYFPKRWRSWKTIRLQKPGKPDYTIAKMYHPITLYNTMGKIISGIMTDITVYLTVRHNLPPPCNFGGLPNRMTVDSLLYLTHWVKEVWHKWKVATIIFLDIANTFPNPVMEWLLKNMARLGYPSEIVSFFKAMLKDRKTMLSSDDFTSLPFNIDNGIGQGETASMIFDLIYSYSLVAVPQGTDKDGGAYMDDNFIMAIADTFEECNTMLNNILDKQSAWSVAYNSQAEISKFQCQGTTSFLLQNYLGVFPTLTSDTFGILWTPTTSQFQKHFRVLPTLSPSQQPPTLPHAPSTQMPHPIPPLKAALRLLHPLKATWRPLPTLHPPVQTPL